MNDASRRDFLAAGLALPAGLTSSPSGLTAPLQGGSGLRYRTLGRTKLKVTTVGYGCMITSDASVIARAVDAGVTYFDTSRWYQKGNNERMVGAALGSNRKKVILSTKVDAETREGALGELEMSLKELGTDYLDIWYLHGKDSPEAIKDELVEAQEIARKQGKTRFTGISTHKVAAVADAVIRNGKLDAVLAVYNFTMDPSTGAAIDSLAAAGIGVAAMKVMAGGLRGRNPRPQMKRPGAMTAALRWVLKNPKVATTIPSMTDMEQLEQNFKAMTEGFSADDEKVLAARLEEIRPWFCRMCGQCDGKCPQGLPVSEMVRYAMYADSYGQFGLGRERFLSLPEAVREVRCGACPECQVQCPNGVRVADRLIRAQELFA